MLRLAAYLFALAVIAITVPLTAAAGQHGIAVAVLGGTLAVTPYVVVRAIEEVANESVQSPAGNRPGACPPHRADRAEPLTAKQP